MLDEPDASFVVLCGAGKRAVAAAPDLLRHARAGTWIIWESALHALLPHQIAEMQSALSKVFGVGIGAPLHSGLYIRYEWPQTVLTRSFLQVAPVISRSGQIIARDGETPVAVRKQIGSGGILFLGAMLGPNLYAEEAQAHAIARRLISS